MPVTNAFRDLTPSFIYLLLTATLGPLLFGYHLAELNAPQEVVTCVKSNARTPDLSRSRSIFGNPNEVQASDASLPQCIPMSPIQFGLVSSFFTLGGLVGALAAGPVTARYGRWRTMLYMGIFAIIGPIFEALASNIGLMTTGRFISGIGAGAATVVVPIYISEIAPPGKKGFFGSFTQVMINCGILIAQVLGLFLSRGQLWRIILGVAGGIALLQCITLVLGGQESPKWMADNGMPSRAKKILQNIRGHEADISEEVSGWSPGSERDFDDEEQTLLTNEDHMHHHSDGPDSHAGLLPGGGHEGQHDNTDSLARRAAQSAKRETVGVLTVFRHPDYAPAVFAVTMIMVAQQLLGINSIIMYGVGLLSELLAANSAILNVGVAALNIFITFACAPLSDKLGRKKCLLLSMAGMGLSSLLLAVGIMRSVPILSAVAVIAFVAAFGLGLGPVPFILSSELVNSEAVGATQSWALAANWIATFIVAQFFPVVNEKLGKGQVYFIFAAFALAFGAFTAWWVPETKGKSNADEVWGRKKSPERQD